jgi:DNA repair exonuclease SbcCD nuclease subunit
MKKALVCADLHLNINNRFEDTKAILNQIANLAGSQAVDEVWVLGDVYDKKRPYNSERVLFHKFVKCLVDQLELKVIIISGNHDTDQFNVSALEEFNILDLENVYLLPNPTVVNLGKFNVYLGHFLVNGAKLGSLDYAARSTMNVEEILKTEADLYLLGDVHKAQKLNTNPDMLYVGSPERISFGERDEIKGVTIVEASPADIRPRYTFHPLSPRNMIQIDVEIADDIIEYAMVEHKDAIVKIVVTCSKEDYSKFSEAEMRENFCEAYSIKFEYIILKEDRQMKSTISEGSTPLKAFEEYSKTVELDEKTFKLGKLIIGKV